MKYEFKIDLDNMVATARALASENDTEPRYEAMIEQMLNLAANMLGSDIDMDPIEYENNKFTMPFKPHAG